MSASVSAYVVYAATSHDLANHGAEHENFFYSSYDHDAAYAGALHGEPSWFSATVPTLIDPSLAPEGEHLVVLTTLITAKDGAQWRTLKPYYNDWLLGQAEERLPGLRGGLTLAEGASPRTMERYTRNEGGALYGFDVSPAQVGPGRPDHVTPLAGLYLAGHWTRPGGGIAGVVTSGVQAARKILGVATDADLLTHGFLS
jgi:prolycopene isomerase